MSSLREENMEDFTITSFDGTPLHAVCAIAPNEKAVVQFVHGASDRANRYEEFAQYLNKEGISFYAIDMRGHGQSESRRGPYVYLERGDGDRMVKDQLHFTRIIREKSKSPINLIGHSLGSHVARVMAFRSNAYKNYFYLGTSYEASFQVKLHRLMVEYYIKTQSRDYYSRKIDQLYVEGFMQDMLKKGYIHNKSEWLSRDVQKQETLKMDIKMAKRFTVGSYLEVLDIVEKSQDKKMISLIDPRVKHVFMSGIMDPVGGYGEGVRKAAKLYQESSPADVNLILYKGNRHELLQEIDRVSIYQKIASLLQ